MSNIWDVQKGGTYYFARSYHHLWTEAEVNAESAFLLDGKIRKLAKTGTHLGDEMRDQLQLMVRDPDIATLFQKGWQQFYEDLALRIRQDCAHLLQKCPKCDEVLRTGKAEQCFECGYDWHLPNIDQPQSPRPLD